MAIINKNQIVLKDCGLTLDETHFSSYCTQTLNNRPTSVRVTVQTGFFLNAEKMYESPTNALKVVGYDTIDKYIFEFDLDVELINGIQVLNLYTMDLILRAHLLECFPTWDESLLILTTEPVE